MPFVPFATRFGAGLLTGLVAFLMAPAAAAADVVTPPAVVVTPEDAALHVAWSAFAGPADAVTGYDVTATPTDAGAATSAVVSTTADVTDTDVAGLANGVRYTVTVVAVGLDGTQVSAPAVTDAVPRTVPGAPVVTAVAGLDGSARVSWAPPAEDGGAPITSYVVASQPIGASVTLTANVRSTVVTGLTNGVGVSLQVSAVNEAGTGAPSGTGATTPRKAARLVVTAPPRPVAYGTTSTLGAKVLTTSGSAVSNARVELRGRSAGTATWRTLATAVTNGSGQATLRAALRVNTVLSLHHATDNVVAADAAVGTAGVAYRVTAPTRPKAVRVAHTVTVSGHVTPTRRAGTKVQLQRWSAGAWRTILTGRIQKHSSYRLTWTPRQPGAYALRSITPRDAVRSAGTSAGWHQRIAPENAADVAAAILHNHRITLADAHESGVQDAATALDDIRDIAAGRPAHRSAYQNAPGGSTRVNLDLLRAIRAIGLRLTVTVSEIAGGSHAIDSGHYQGRAVDVTVVNGRSIAGGGTYGVIAANCRANGATKVFDPAHDPDGGHGNHVHCEWS